MKLKIYAIFALASAIFITACQPPTAPPVNQTANTNTKTTGANNQWDAYVNQFLNDYFAANPQFAVYPGKHEFDGKLSDWSEDGLKKEIARLHSGAR